MLIIVLFLFYNISSFGAAPIEDDFSQKEHLDENSLEFKADDVIDFSHLGERVYGIPKNESGDALSTWSESSPMNPEEMGEYVEGDILIPIRKGQTKNGLRDVSTRWPNGIIPYVVEGFFTRDQLGLIKQAMEDYRRYTCIRFVPYNGQRDYIVITSSNTGCWSAVGRLGGRQEVNLQNPGCVTTKGTIVHELLHTVGFFHEQSRTDRDRYVRINYRNISPGTEVNFEKALAEQVNDFGVPYDYKSVMHYSEYAFSWNGGKTIEARVPGIKLGQRDGFSQADITKVNKMYRCIITKPTTEVPTTQQPTVVVDPDDNDLTWLFELITEWYGLQKTKERSH